MLKIYKLDDWGAKSKRQFVWLQKERRLPRANEGDSVDVRNFLQILDRDRPTRVISGLPFYCRILFDQHVSGDLAPFSDEIELIDHTINAMKEREIEKGQFDSNSFEDDGLDDWLEQIAADYVEGRYAGFRQDEAEEYGRYVLRDGLTENEQHHILTSLLNFPLFQAGNESGKLAFVHDLIADAIAARHYLKRLSREAHEVFKRLAHVDVDGPPLLRFMARRLDQAGRAALAEELRLPSKDRSFAVALTLMMLAKPGRDVLRKGHVNLEDRFLVGVQFSDLDLSKSSFRGSDLTYASFNNCDLSGASFDSAYFNHTAFRGDCILRGTDVRGSRAQSIVIGSRVEDDIDRIHAWFHKASGIATSTGHCPTAQQFMHLFSKFVTPLGSARRDRMERMALSSGKRFAGAASMEDCMRAAVSAGYLSQPDFRGRYSRASGDEYAEIVEFVKERRASDGIGKMLEKLCARPNCLHQLE